jgi:transcriptional regulator with XRE-family HTH domain
MRLAEKLKELRNRAGLSQSELARASGLSLAAIQDYEQDRREPRFPSLVKLAAALGTDCRAFAECEFRKVE